MEKNVNTLNMWKMSLKSRKIIYKTLFYVLFLFLSLCVIMPFILMLLTSFKTMPEIQSPKFAFIPERIMLENYMQAFSRGDWPRYFFNSTFVTLCAVGGSLLFNSMAGYSFARLNFPGVNLLFMLALLGMMVPPQSIMIPMFIILKNMPLFGGNDIFGNGGTGWVNTYWGLIVPQLAGSFGVFLCRQFYLNFPKSLDEAASIDGCSKLKTYFQIYLPLSGPVLATLAIFKATFSWNDYTWPLILTNTREMQTVQLGLTVFRTEYVVQWNLLMAGTATITLPILLMFLFLQKYFVSGIVNSGIKG